MKTLLKLTTSIFGENGASSQLTEAFVARWLAAHPGACVIVRDLAADPVPHLTGGRVRRIQRQARRAQPGAAEPPSKRRTL